MFIIYNLFRCCAHQKRGLWAGPRAHNLLVMWVLDFLLWVVLNAEIQQSDLFYEFLYSHCYYYVALSLPLLLVSYATLPIPSFASHIYSQKLVESYDYFHG